MARRKLYCWLVPATLCLSCEARESDPWGDEDGVGSEFPAEEGGSLDEELLNVPEEAAGGEGSESGGCEKIDFLFVLDNSGSMAAAQDALRDAFPDFAGSILNHLGVEDHHVLVVDSDDKRDIIQSCDDFSSSIQTDPEVPREECDERFGAGNMISSTVNAAWTEIAEKRCDFGDERRFLRSSDDDFLEKFECIASVGSAGSSRERPLSAMVRSLRNETDGCNGGFVREDAILVVTIVSDDFPNDAACPGDAEGTPEDVAEWVGALKETKEGRDGAITVLFVHDKLNQMVPSFDAFVEGMGDDILESSIYDANYMVTDFTSIFEEAVEEIQDSCENFTPIG